MIATFCPPSGRDPCIYQQPLSRKAPPVGGDEDTAAAPGNNGIFFISVLLYRLFFLTDSKNLFCFDQVNPSDPHKAADMLLKIASLYNEEPETKTAVFEIVGK